MFLVCEDSILAISPIQSMINKILYRLPRNPSKSNDNSDVGATLISSYSSYLVQEQTT